MSISFIEKTTKRKKLRFAHRDLFIAFVAVFSLVVYLIFPAQSAGESFFSYFIIYLLFPLIVIRFLIKEPLSNFGLQNGLRNKGILFSAILVIIFLGINYLVVKIPALRGNVTIFPEIAVNIWLFLWFELLIALPLHFVWEFFFRGFIQLGLEKSLGWWSLVAQAFLQAFFFVRVSWVIAALIFLSALGGGLIVRQSRSVYYSFAALWLISVSLDIMMLRFLLQKGI